MNTYQLRIGCHNGAGNFFESVLHYQLNETATGALPYDYAQDLISGWISSNEAAFLLCLGTDVHLDFYAAKKVTGGGGPEAVQTSTSIGTGAGVSAGSSIAANVAVYTASPTNRQGHIYVGGIPKASISEDAVINPGLGNLISFGTSVQAPIVLAGTAGTATYGVWSKKLATFFAVVEIVVRTILTLFNQRKKPLV